MNTEGGYPDQRVGRYWKYLANVIYFGDTLDPRDALKVFEAEFITDIKNLRLNGMLPDKAEEQ